MGGVDDDGHTDDGERGVRRMPGRFRVDPTGVRQHSHRATEDSSMITKDMTRELIGRQVVDNHGEKVGKIGQIYLDERSGDPTWATVNTGLFGTKESFVPLQNADVHDRDVALGWRRRQSRTARTWAAPTSA
ncbi:hypothetical protein GCM10009629_21340 [Pseudonocardia alni]